jgi:hypothetical protein
MTNTQTTHHEVQKNKPLNESRYTGFYLTLLILSTVGTSMGIFSLIGVGEAIGQFGAAPLYTIFSLINVAVVLPIAIWALVLLWMKRPLGIWLKLGSYALSIICAIGLLLSAAPAIKNVAAQMIAESAQSSSKPLDASVIETIASVAIYAGISLSIIVSIIFGLLWYFAWKKQREADSE